MNLKIKSKVAGSKHFYVDGVQMDEFSKQLQQIMNTQRRFDEIQRALSPLAQSIIQAQESYAKYFQNLQSQIQTALNPYISQVNLMQNQFIQQIQPYIETINRVREYTDLMAKVIGPISFQDALRETYREYERIRAIEGLIEQESALDAYFDSITSEVREVPKSVLSLEFYMSLIISLILYFAAQHSSNESEARLQARFNRLEAEISYLSKQIEVASNSSFYMVDRTASLRAAPYSRSAIIGELPPDQKVELLEKRKTWVNVQYFSSMDRVLMSGWVLKKYLFRVNLKRP